MRILALALLVAALAGCGATVTGTPTPGTDAALVPATAKVTTPAPTHSQAPQDNDTAFRAEIGECVRLGGAKDDADIAVFPCGSPEANYKIIGKAPTKEQCVKDANSYYYETVDGIEQGAFCLDYDWVVGGCMDFAAEDPKHIPCTQRTSKGVKVVAIQPDKTSVDDCPTDGGYVYDQRKFAVCTEDLPK